MACGIVSFDGIYQSNEWIFYKLLCYGLRVKCSLIGVCFECSVPSLGTWLFESPGAIRRHVLAGGGRLLGGVGLLKVIPALVLACPFSWPITIRGVSDTCSHHQELHPAFLSLMDESSYETMSPRKSSLLCFRHVYFQHDEKSFKRKKHSSCAAKTSSVFTQGQTSC